MTLKQKRVLFLVFWFLVISAGPITVFKNAPISSSYQNPVILANVFQRITGLLAFSLLFIQIVLGSQLDRWVQIIGGKAYKLHITQGIITYGFMFIHPLFENAIVYQVSRSLTEAILVFMPSFETQRDIFLVFGRAAFILATIASLAAYFRTKPFFRRNWRAFHILNYLVFFLVFVHARVGTDVNTVPFVWLRWISIFVIPGTILIRFLPITKRYLAKPQMTENLTSKK